MAAIDALRYGWTLFVGVPLFIGFLSAVLLRIPKPRSLRVCVGMAIAAACVVGLMFLFLGQEGVICLFMALPLSATLVAAGAWAGWLLLHKSRLVTPLSSLVGLVLLWAAGFVIETSRPAIPPTYAVSNSILIHASPSQVWHSLVTLGELGDPADLIFRLGVACPERVDIYGSGVGADRVCTLSTGKLHERITTWHSPKEVSWVSLSTPPPLKEINPFGETNPPHLHGFYQSVSGSFRLTEISTGRTLVTRTSSYQHNLYPAAYWRLWCDYVAERGHVHVLNILKQAAERAHPQSNSTLKLPAPDFGPGLKPLANTQFGWRHAA